jgi:hypothetical protein
MRKTELFAQILKTVANETELHLSKSFRVVAPPKRSMPVIYSSIC